MTKEKKFLRFKSAKFWTYIDMLTSSVSNGLMMVYMGWGKKITKTKKSLIEEK